MALYWNTKNKRVSAIISTKHHFFTLKATIKPTKPNLSHY